MKMICVPVWHKNQVVEVYIGVPLSSLTSILLHPPGILVNSI